MRKRLKVLLFLALFLLPFASCSKEKNDAPSSREIIRKYGETLATSPERAKDAARKAEDRSSQEERAIKELEN